MLVGHLDGILNYCRTKVPLGVVEAINGNIKSLLRRGRGYRNLRYLLLKAQRIAPRTNSLTLGRPYSKWASVEFLLRSSKTHQRCAGECAPVRGMHRPGNETRENISHPPHMLEVSGDPAAKLE